MGFSIHPLARDIKTICFELHIQTYLEKGIDESSQIIKNREFYLQTPGVMSFLMTDLKCMTSS
jgi:hypothetical protein